jgi:hypothetical protein
MLVTLKSVTTLWMDSLFLGRQARWGWSPVLEDFAENLEILSVLSEKESFGNDCADPNRFAAVLGSHDSHGDGEEWDGNK